MRRVLARGLDVAKKRQPFLLPQRPSSGSLPSQTGDLELGTLDGDRGWDDPPKPLSEAEKKRLIRQMIRANILSEVAAARLAAGQTCTERQRPDLALRKEREADLLRMVEQLAPEYRVRPSLLRPLVAALGFSLGSVSSLLPRQASGAIAGGVQEALTEQYNDQLRELREAGLAETAQDVREALRELRDEERAPLDAVQAPDLLKMQRPQELSGAELLAGAVKYGLKGLLSLGSRV